MAVKSIGKVCCYKVYWKSLLTNTIAVKSLENESGYQQDNCDIYRKILGTKWMAVNPLEGVLGPAG